VHGTLRLFPVFISPVVWNMCEHLHYESVYFKELQKEQEYYIQDGAAVVSTITSIGMSNHIAAIVRDLEKRWRILNFSDLSQSLEQASVKANDLN